MITAGLIWWFLSVSVLLIGHVPAIIFSVNKTYYSITLYACIYHTQFSFCRFTWCRNLHDILFFKTPFCLIPYKEVRMHTVVVLLTSTKSLCCSWSFASSPAVTELRKLCSNSVRNHCSFTTHCSSDWPMSAVYRWNWVWPRTRFLVFWNVSYNVCVIKRTALPFVLAIPSLHFQVNQTFRGLLLGLGNKILVTASNDLPFIYSQYN